MNQFAQILPLPHPACDQFADTSPDWIVHASQLGNVGFFVQLARDHPIVDLAARIACDHFFCIRRDRGDSKRAVPSPHAASLLLSPHNVPSLPSAPSTPQIVSVEHPFTRWEWDLGASALFLSLAAELASRGIVVERADADDHSEHARLTADPLALDSSFSCPSCLCKPTRSK
ncbi:hypothetical protein BLNAU_23119 [Blattamonas nauphoetae]|uniref:Uncharacterized protein n=1 Tax=Blattamonas nauphoetae TaxID=2049346 RepID=A0ABQ9WU71_9EUKA|nr:hypothetical protein BLNAU_23119 [Blattamonas nauphoetae]